MRIATGLLSVTFLCSLASADTPKQAAPPAGLPAKDKLLDPIQVESLTLTPIITTEPPKEDQALLVLDEAMPKKLVKIKEQGEGSVNDLVLTNSANQPLFLLAGEVIIGGKQDRIIGRNTIVPPKTTQSVPVFCVEHGRWDGKTKEFTTAKALAHGRLRGSANFDTQQDVWNEVAAKNQARKTTSDTDTYRKVAQQQSDGTMTAWQKKVDAGLDKLSADDRAKLVGFAVSVNGKVASVDVFTSPSLFKKLQPKLVHSYITDAVDVKVAKDIKPPTTTEVQSFIADAEKAKEEKSYETTVSGSDMKKGMHAAKARVYYKKAAPPAPVASGAAAPAAPTAAKPADDDAVYETYQAR